MIRVCKQVKVVGPVERCYGSKEFLTCRMEVAARTEDVCGEGTTTAEAVSAMQRKLSELLAGRCKSMTCEVQPQQSATYFESFGEWIERHGFLRGCGDPMVP